MRFLIVCFFLTNSWLMAQTSLPLDQIPSAPDTVTAGNVLARMTQGLGYRYHWATKNLRAEDLAYRPSQAAASSYETLEHIYGLAEIIRNSALGQPSKRPIEAYPKDYTALRLETLALLNEAQNVFLEANTKALEQMEVIFERGEKTSRFPIWNLINGPLSDALYHTGQLVSFRRTTGNPIPSGVNVFMGKTKE